jgi:uncharacterized protein (PEP-CTERM system associated)
MGTDRLSLFKGEVYGGYMEQFYNPAIGGAQSGPSFGGKLTWSPLEYLTVSGAAGTSYGSSVASAATPTAATPTQEVNANLNVTYALAQNWSASARVNYLTEYYLGVSRIDHDWTGGVTLNRQFWRNLYGTADYQIVEVDSNYPGASFVQNIYSLGLTYKF